MARAHWNTSLCSICSFLMHSCAFVGIVQVLILYVSYVCMNLPGPCEYYVCIYFFRARTAVPSTSTYCATHLVLQLSQVYFVPFLENPVALVFLRFICSLSRLALLHLDCDTSIMDVSSCISTSVTIVTRMFTTGFFFSKRRNIIQGG